MNKDTKLGYGIALLDIKRDLEQIKRSVKSINEQGPVLYEIKVLNEGKIKTIRMKGTGFYNSIQNIEWHIRGMYGDDSIIAGPYKVE